MTGGPDLTRRAATLAGVAALAALSVREAAASPDAWLAPTGHIDCGHKAVRAKAADLTAGLTTEAGKARAIFTFVSTQIPFGFGRGMWDQRASDVLSLGRGYCNTKSTLFTALLRAAGLPARQVFVDIHRSVLRGILNPGTDYVDHSYVEIWLNGQWIATDAYIVDPPLFAAGGERLQVSGDLMGHGRHATGTCEWDAETPSFSQYNILDPRPIGERVWGVYADVGDFYAHAPAPHNRMNPLLRAGFGALAAEANSAADRLRAG